MALMAAALPVTIAIPTYGREGVLLQTIEDLLALPEPAAEVLVLDQTGRHEQKTEAALAGWHARGLVRWLRLPVPSIPQAMNRGLLEARQPVVLFLDDDIHPDPGLVREHHHAHRRWPEALVAGKVLQPWDEGKSYPHDIPFHFASDQPRWITQFMGGNFSIPRELAIRLGGFDENFVRVAYRFEAEFAHRVIASGRRIRYEPAASLHHLKVASGGTRTFGEHLTTWRPDHAVGAYYFGLRCRAWREFLGRPWRSVATKYHLRHPWRTVPTFVAELRGMAWALALHAKGPRLIQPPTSGSNPP